MIVVRDHSTIDQISNPAIRELVQQRINDLGGESFDSNELGYFLVVESSDTLEAMSAQLGFDMLRVLDDTGIGVEIFVPKEEGIDPDLIAMCRMYAYTAPPEDSP